MSTDTEREIETLVALAEKCGAEIGRHGGEVCWIKFHQPSIAPFAAAIQAGPAVGWMVHSSDDITTAALYSLSKREQAFDAARRWGARITEVVASPRAPDIAALAQPAPAAAPAAPLKFERTKTGPLDANELEQFAKEHPDEYFLKGSGVLTLIAGIRQLERQLRAAAAPAEPSDLYRFYGVTTDAELIAAQARHVEKLQAKLPATPSLAPQRVREG